MRLGKEAVGLGGEYNIAGWDQDGPGLRTRNRGKAGLVLGINFASLKEEASYENTRTTQVGVHREFTCNQGRPSKKGGGVRKSDKHSVTR
jgi:hypothetical protein